MFDNVADANAYLRNTVCYWDGQPTYIDRIREDFVATAYVLPILNNSLLQEFNILDPRFNCRKFNLGYMNSVTKNRAYYVTRRPARHIQQGICDINTSFINSGGGGNGPFDEDGFGIARAIRDQGFVDMLQGRYPNMAEVRNRLQDKAVSSVAVGPWLAIKRHGQFNNLHFLEYRGREVSFSETLEFGLPQEFQYLREICAPTGVLKVA